MKFSLFHYPGGNNLGDEIQSIAARRFLPRVDVYLHRDHLADVASNDGEPIALIGNAWYANEPQNWPPAPSIVPLLIAIHISRARAGGGIRPSAADVFLRDEAAEYLKVWGPVGARDLETLRLLESRNIPCYFSGCLTLTLQSPLSARADDLVVVNDLPEKVLTAVRRRTRKTVMMTSHRDEDTAEASRRFAKAQELLELYARATCVITSRLHCAMPCLALGTPVLLIDLAKDKSRFAGLEDLAHRCNLNDFLAGKSDFDVDRPPPNSGAHQSLRDSLERRAAEFVAQCEAGMIGARLDAVWTMQARLRILTALYAEQTQQCLELRQAARRGCGIRRAWAKLRHS